ncbi:MAG: CDP-archaeol synthase [Thermoleophilia bacterium]|nr:CDP-archaeol synthase [Thermoleophilia bacterium]
MMSRLAVAIPGIAVIVLALWLGGAVFGVFVLAVALVALREFYAITGTPRGLQGAGYATAVLAVALSLWVTPAERGLLTALGAGLVMAAIAALTRRPGEAVTTRVGLILMGGMYIALPAGVLVLTRDLPDGVGGVILVLVGVWVFDTASYLCGMAVGRTPIAPRISPNKTWEGFIGGVVVGTAGVWVAGLSMDWIAWWQSVVIGVVVCLSAYLGDLFESMIKRDLGVKDSGTILRGHGGVLDRFDSLFFASLTGYVLIVWMVL